MFDLTALTGVHVAEAEAEAEEKHRFVADEAEFKRYYDCNTVAVLADIFHLASIKRNEKRKSMELITLEILCNPYE